MTGELILFGCLAAFLLLLIQGYLLNTDYKNLLRQYRILGSQNLELARMQKLLKREIEELKQAPQKRKPRK